MPVRNVTHELIGVSATLAVATTADLTAVETTAAAVAAFHGSWLPDVDQLGSRVHRRSRLERRSLPVGAAGALLRLPLVAFAALASHRALTYSLLASVAATALFGVALAPFAPAIAV